MASIATPAATPHGSRLRRLRELAGELPDRIYLSGIVLIGAALRFATLGAQSYRYDEAVTAARVIHPSLFDTLATIPNSESAPPLYYLLAWFWSRLFGVGEVGLRSLSALAGVASIVVIHYAAKTLIDRRAGLIAAAIVAINPVLIWFSQDARAYSLVFLLTSVSFLFFARIWRAKEGRPSGRLLAGWAIASALALCTHYFAVFVVVPEAALLLWGVQNRRAALVAVACVGAVGLALLPLALHQSSSGRAAWIGREPLGNRLERIGAKLVGDDNGNEHGVRTPGPLPLALPAGLALAAVALLIGLAGRRERARAGPVIAVAAGGVGLALLAAALGQDYIVGRNMLPVFVPLIVILAAGFAVKRAGLVGLVLAAAFLAAGLAFTLEIARLQKFQREDAAAAAREIGPANAPRAIVTLRFALSWPLKFYLPDTRSAAGTLPPLREIDLLGSGKASRRALKLLPGFHRTEFKQVTYNYMLSRFRSQRPRRVPLSLLVHGRFVDGTKRAAVLVDGTNLGGPG